MRTETWECGTGLEDVRVDDDGCPIDRKFCKTQAGDRAVAIVTGAAWTLTITIANFVEARVKGFVLAAFDNAAGNADLLHTQLVTSIRIQGDEQLGNGVVSGERYRADATGAKVGSGEQWRGRLGTTGGNLVVTGLNLSGATVDIIGTVDVNAIRG
jgi:hypothetical protein